MNLKDTIIIIESPNKIQKIEKITQAKVFATKGHFKNLNKDIFKDYENYEPIFEFSDDDVKKRMNYIFSQCKNKDVIIATDPDREGYGIAYLFYDVIKNIAKSIKRAEFHEITEAGIKKGIENSVEFSRSNLNDFEAFKGRIVGDKLVGFLMSPKYINILNNKDISIGRVQTPALSLIVKREKEILEFKSNPNNQKLDYKIKVKLEKDGQVFYANNQNLYSSKEEALEAIEKLRNNKQAQVFNIETKNSEIKPDLPFRTSQFQEKMNKIFGYTPDKAMALAQSLFEKGLITYHRTDSNALSNEFLNEVENFFKNEEWYLKKEYKAGEQSQAEAHEAIRISHIHSFEDIEKIANKEKLTDDEIETYKLIFLNSIQSQAKNAINEIKNYEFPIGILTFKASVSKCIYKGFKKIFEFQEEQEEQEEQEQKINLELKEKEEVNILDFELIDVKKKAPQRYKESNFISLLEKAGIGRPSTYASFLPTLLKRKYIELKKKGKNNEIVATDKGISLIDILIEKNDEWIATAEFTKQMENILDTISKGDLKYIDFIKPLHSKMDFVKLNEKSKDRENLKPSDKQIQYAEKLAKDNNLTLPENYKENMKICSEFITNALKNTKPQPASDKQIQYAEKLAKDNNLTLPENYKENMKICSEFITNALKKKG
ncbi:type IA DNA topoisomerase [Campylobacter lari]|uniref:type IA DNA topoisomerase n=3 Tax=Campylobacter lari TaxID=201 RepID=UPI00127EEBD5|nr:type IA DNA topoisomerase [Campylobacter lari]EAK0768207.1 type IA DNA topoisomerase [Campylobacter lari]EDP6895642.1 type IA DNA topoisomerase [Campylobacter lari]EJV5920788.1 type IA DNA topoisomerase [Campylobacter lari]MCV3399063.1 type IA DNA topoisomerase [Campylobacter lari]MCV3414623.1 type IA DNA topoisomerase [Campylobacter lari]